MNSVSKKMFLEDCLEYEMLVNIIAFRNRSNFGGLSIKAALSENSGTHDKKNPCVVKDTDTKLVHLGIVVAFTI